MGIFQPAMLVYQRVHDTHMTTQVVNIQINHLICSKTTSDYKYPLNPAEKLQTVVLDMFCRFVFLQIMGYKTIWMSHMN